VPDAQTTLDEAAGLIAFVQALVATLAARVDDGETVAPVASWRIAENRFSALRHGVEGTLSDLRCPRRLATRERLSALVEEVEPMARSLGADHLLRHTRDSIARNGAIRQREAGSSSGIESVPAWLAARYL
jgi:glutamate---cysteine ligase / carboxylate-amine ligase